MCVCVCVCVECAELCVTVRYLQPSLTVALYLHSILLKVGSTAQGRWLEFFRGAVTRALIFKICYSYSLLSSALEQVAPKCRKNTSCEPWPRTKKELDNLYIHMCLYLCLFLCPSLSLSMSIQVSISVHLCLYLCLFLYLFLSIMSLSLSIYNVFKVKLTQQQIYTVEKHPSAKLTLNSKKG